MAIDLIALALAKQYTDKSVKEVAAAGGQVQSDWNQTNTAAVDYIKNKPSSLPASDVSAWAKQPSKPEYTVQEVGAVATVNGIAPDENGNVKVDIPEGGATPEQAKQIADNKTAIEKIQESMVCGIGISKIMRITQSEYDALETKDETTLYIIADGASTEEPEDGMIPYLHITAPCDIDTGILQTVDTAVEVTVYDTDLKNANGYIGGYKYSISGQNAPWLGAVFGTVTFSCKVTNFTTTGVKNTYRLDNTGLYINGALAQAASATPTDPGWTNYAAERSRLRLFCAPVGLYPDSASPGCYLDDAKFYGAKIWQAGELVRDIIPATDSSGVACVYDKVSGTYLYKTATNTGTLTYGEEVDE